MRRRGTFTFVGLLLAMVSQLLVVANGCLLIQRCDPHVSSTQSAEFAFLCEGGATTDLDQPPSDEALSGWNGDALPGLVAASCSHAAIETKQRTGQRTSLPTTQHALQVVEPSSLCGPSCIGTRPIVRSLAAPKPMVSLSLPLRV